MPQEDKAKEASVTFKAKAGLPSDPQPMEVHAAEGDLKPWDLDTLPGFQHMGKPHTRFDGPLKVTGQAKYTHDVKLPGMLCGRMVGAAIPAAVTELLSRRVDDNFSIPIAAAAGAWVVSLAAF